MLSSGAVGWFYFWFKITCTGFRTFDPRVATEGAGEMGKVIEHCHLTVTLPYTTFRQCSLNTLENHWASTTSYGHLSMLWNTAKLSHWHSFGCSYRYSRWCNRLPTIVMEKIIWPLWLSISWLLYIPTCVNQHIGPGSGAIMPGQTCLSPLTNLLVKDWLQFPFNLIKHKNVICSNLQKNCYT